MARKADPRKLVNAILAELTFSPPKQAQEGHDPEVVKKAQAEVPALLSVLKQLQERVEVLQDSVNTLSERFTGAEAEPGSFGKSGQSTATYVEAKVQMLLSYVIGLVYYLLLKANGLPVRDHPVARRLFWIRSALEKMRPVDQRLQYQISKLLQWADARKAGARAAGAEALSLKPGELAAGVEDEPEDDVDGTEADDRGVYRPPKIAQVEFTDTHVTLREQAEKDLERKRQRLERSEFVRSLREEFTDTPAEVPQELRTNKAAKASRLLLEQQAFEEEYMRRIKASKADMKKLKTLRRNQDNSGGTLDDATLDFDQLSASFSAARRPSRGRKGRRGGSALEEFQAASKRVNETRHLTESAHGNLMKSLPKRKRVGAAGHAKRRKG
eukprot:CAMPEP_0171135932 /NCGR_PEP_ID=MMETSP0766_2-20121228/130631_1 /TAXON_ID=439317 /ORGANISM="Gambierdiscus australes, Strain CAWD 149" /LENGTH=384 /DNA_ID=CAMNT_0011599449 /DNA_START=18 /DNA_END=1172 /DNA_ORIENTATION=+